jgi:hypothetical protein
MKESYNSVFSRELSFDFINSSQTFSVLSNSRCNFISQRSFSLTNQTTFQNSRLLTRERPNTSLRYKRIDKKNGVTSYQFMVPSWTRIEFQSNQPTRTSRLHHSLLTSENNINKQQIFLRANHVLVNKAFSSQNSPHSCSAKSKQGNVRIAHKTSSSRIKRRIHCLSRHIHPQRMRHSRLHERPNRRHRPPR